MLILLLGLSGCGQVARSDKLRDTEISDLHRQMVDMNSRVTILERRREQDSKRMDRISELKAR
jgi:hypothetical protein